MSTLARNDELPGNTGSKKAFKTGARLATIALATLLGGNAWAVDFGGTSTKTVIHYYFFETAVPSPTEQTVETFSTTIEGFLEGSSSPVASFSFNLPIDDAIVQASLASIRNSLTGAAGGPLSFVGPALESSTRTKVGTTVVGANEPFDIFNAADLARGAVLAADTTELVGEDTFFLEESYCSGLTEAYSFCKNEPTPLFVAAGNTVLLTSVELGVAIDRTTTTTNTFLTTQRYSITGTPAIASPIPEPSTWMLMAPFVGFLAFRSARSQRKNVA